MIATDLQSLLEEIRDWKQYAEPFIQKRKELCQHTAGPHYRQGEGVKAGTPENVAYTYKSFVKPQLLFGRPTAKVIANSPEMSETAKAMEIAINYWAKEVSLKDIFSEVIDDCFVGFGMTLSGVSTDPSFHGRGLGAVYDDFEQVPNYPFTIRIDPRCAIFDRRAKSLRACRMIGHTFEQDLEDVAVDPRNDPEAVKRLPKADNERPLAGDPQTVSFAGDAAGMESERKRVTIHEIYLPEHKLLIAIAETGTAAADGILLRQADFFGPDEGPFQLWGLDTVAGELIPLSPLVALWDRYLEVVEHARAAADSAASHKKLGVYEPGAADDAKNIQNAKPGALVPVKSINSVKDFELGGASQQQLDYVEYSRTRMEHDLGFGQAQQGIAGNETATAQNIAQNNSDLRVDRMRDKIADCIAAVYRKVAWYFFHDANIAPMQTSVTNEQTGAVQAATMVPGPWNGGHVQLPNGALQFVPPEPPTDFTDYHFEVDPSSLVKTDNALEQKRAQDEMALAFQLLQMGAPVNLRRVIDRYGEKMGTKDLSKILLLDQGQVIPQDPLAMQSMMGGQPGMKPQAGIPGMPGGSGSVGMGMGGRGFPPSDGPGAVPNQAGGGPMPQLPAMLGAAQRVA